MPFSSGLRAMGGIPGTLALAAFTLGAARSMVAQQPQSINIEVLQLRPHFYMIAGAGGNVAFQIGADGVVVVDSGSASSADTVVAAIKKVRHSPSVT